MPNHILVANWKMNTSSREAELLADVARRTAVPGVESVLCPPFVWLDRVKTIVEGSGVRVGAQNLHWEGKGAYTGEISGPQLRELCEYVIVGHSERRTLFGESDAIVAKKLHAAAAYGLIPILCVGESVEARQAGKTEQVIGRQVLNAVAHFGGERLLIAYEPIWAIGSGTPATPAQAQAAAKLILSCLGTLPGNTDLRVLYGGSVSPTSLAGFVEQPDIDGALVGGASLHTEQYTQMVRIAATITA